MLISPVFKRYLFPYCWKGLLTLAYLVSSTMVATAEGESYRELDWKDLVPADWKPPIILPAPPEEGEHHPVDPASLVQSLDGQAIVLPGFMIPMVFEQNVVSEFLMVPFLEQHIRSHIHHDPNQMLYVYLDPPVAIHNPYAPLVVKGKLLVESVETDEGPTGYSVKAAVIEPYSYPTPGQDGSLAQ